MEYLLVCFAEKRRVIIDDVDTGQHTDEVIELEAGHHIIKLGEPADFAPPSQAVILRNTTELDPMEVHFAKN